MGHRLILGVAALVTLATPAAALAGDAALRAALDSRLATADVAASRMEGGDPAALQAGYDAARDLDEALRRAAPVGRTCAPLLRAARRYAAARVRQAEALDRLRPADARRAAAAAVRLRAAVGTARPPCRGTARPRPAAAGPGMRPAAGEAFFGAVVARAPAGADRARLEVNGRPGPELPVRGGAVRAAPDLPPGRHDLVLRFSAGGTPAGVRRARGVWRLPASARLARPGTRLDAPRAARLAALGRRFPGVAGIWTQDLASGSVAGWNAGARFPAASTVKPALLVGALARLGPAPERSALLHDLRAMSVWSSNLATNRVLTRLGGSEAGGAAIAQGVLDRLGASSSTFTGGYIVGTELQPRLPGADVRRAPPAVSRRVTTARDLARVLYAVHAAAAGDRAARRATGLGTRSARLALGWLLASEQRGDNRSLVAGGVPAGVPVAQKNGWLRAARHGGAIVYGPGGPRIIVVLTYREGGLPRRAAAALGAAVAREALR